MKIGIFGGTFNPPHLGHISAAAAAWAELGLERLIVIPNTMPPHKELAENSPPPEDRLAMTRAAFGKIGGAVEVSDIELKRDGKSYTVDTLAEIRELYPNDEIILLMGTDMFLSLESWRAFEEIMKTVTLGVFQRSDGQEDEISEARDRFSAKYGAKTVAVKNDPIDVSSSEIRAALPDRGGAAWRDGEVYGYIIRNSLYGAKPDFDWLRVKACEMLDPKRTRHVAGCEMEAVKLARRWGEDESAAREAAIMHDCTKSLGLEEQLLLCEKYDIIADSVERGDAKLLHSKTGACIAKCEFGVSDEACAAIRWHTTGKADMSTLEKIIYLADYIEPSRAFDGLEELRRLAYEDIDAAMLMGLQMSLEDMRDRGIVPHKNSKDAIKWLAKREG